MKSSFSNPRWLTVVAGLLVVGAGILPARGGAADPWEALGKYQFGQSREPLALIEEQMRKAAPADYPALETKMLAVLNAPDTQKDAKRYLCRWLGVVGSAQCVPAVGALLADPDLSHPARIALEKLPTPAAAQALRGALPKVQGNLRIGVITSLGVRRDPLCVGLLRPLVQDADAGVAEAALAALGQIGTEEANRALESAQVAPGLERPLANARLVGAVRLTQAGNRARAASTFRQLMAPEQPRAVRVAALKGLLGALPPREAARLLVDLVQGEDAAMRSAAVSAFIGSDDPGFKNSVAGELPGMKPSGQLLLLGALSDEDDVAARLPVLTVLKSASDQAVRAAAVECLARHGEGQDVALVAGLAAEKNGAVAAAAKGVLTRMSRGGVDAALVALIESPRPGVRAVAVEALASRRTESAFPTLTRLLRGTDAAMAVEAAKALAVMGKAEQLEDVVQVLAATDNGALRTAAEGAAQSICGRASDRGRCAAVVLEALAQAGSPAAKAAMLPVLLHTGGEGALKEVLKALRDENPTLKGAAFRALVAWPEGAAGAPLLELARTSAEANQAIVAVRDGCLRLAQMEEVPQAQRLSILRGVLEVAKRREEKQRAVAILAELPSLGALELLQNCARAPSLKAEATKAVIKLAQSLGAVYARPCLAALEQIKADADSEETRRAAESAIQAVRAAGQSPDGFILGWLVSGPYTEADKDGAALFDVAFAPEKAGAAAEWRPIAAGKNGVVDLGKVMPGDNRVAYLRTVITSQQGREALLEMGSDDGIKVWLNGKVVHANNATRPCVAGQDKARVRLNAGANRLLLKITQGGGEWAACARLCGPDGKPLGNVSVGPEGD